jgi:uncharacterized protein YgbK (DUF1537 family)
MTINVQETFNALPPVWPEDLLPAIRREIDARPLSLVVLDDDPTGTQTVYDVPVLTGWEVRTLVDEFNRRTPLFYVLTNSRSAPQVQAVELAREIGANIFEASRQTGRAFEVISRSDSTLRGHFPAEVDALADVLEMRQAVTLVMPFFEEGGRYTIGDVHYVKEGNDLVPAAQTPFAADAVFGYRHSDLKEWVEEKTRGRVPASSVRSLAIDDIRLKGPDCVASKIAECPPGSVCIVNAADYRDMEVVVLGLLKTTDKGAHFLFRTAASFVRVRAGLRPHSLLTAKEVLSADKAGGLIVIGSHVPCSSEQLSHLLANTDIHEIELNVKRILAPAARDSQISRIVRFADGALSQCKDVVVYTSRELITSDDDLGSLSVGSAVSEALVEIVGSISAPLRYLIAKGGITSSDIATKALAIGRAHVLGQILPGVPVWRCGPESRFPGMPYVVFPGNVGSADAITTVFRSLREPPARRDSAGTL